MISSASLGLLDKGYQGSPVNEACLIDGPKSSVVDCDRMERHDGHAGIPVKRFACMVVPSCAG